MIIPYLLGYVAFILRCLKLPCFFNHSTFQSLTNKSKNMKNFTLIALLILAMACSSGQKEKALAQSNIVSNFLSDVTSLEKVEGGKPIVQFQELAKKIASEEVSLNKENVADFLKEAKKHKHCVIVTGNHTIVKIKDLNNCKASGSWSASMPYAEGYVKKGKLSYREDYVNNIIGRPDSQKRIAYFFN